MLADCRYWAKVEVKKFQASLCVYMYICKSDGEYSQIYKLLSNYIYHASTINYSIFCIIYIRLILLSIVMLTLKCVYVLLGMQLLPNHKNSKAVGTLLPFSSCLFPAHFST